MSSIIFEENRFPRELSSERDIARAVERGRLKADTPVRVVTADGSSPWMIAADVPELRPYFGLADEAADPEPLAADRPEEPQTEPDPHQLPDGARFAVPPQRMPGGSLEHTPLAGADARVRSRSIETNGSPVAQSDDAVSMALLPLRRYADFAGRSRRKEFWSFILLQCVALIVLVVLTGGSQQSQDAMKVLFFLAVLLPNLAVTARRLHDQDQSGWLVLLCVVPWLGWLILLALMCVEGTGGPNRFGPNPRQARGGE